jgi:hypothetical protein
MTDHPSFDGALRQQLTIPAQRPHPYRRTSIATSSLPSLPDSVGNISGSSANLLGDVLSKPRNKITQYNPDERKVIEWACGRIFMNSTTRGWLRIDTTDEKKATSAYVAEVIAQANARFLFGPESGMC